MAACKRIRQREQPKGKTINQGGDPEQYYEQHPAWTFGNADREKWSITQAGELFWTEILPRMRDLETQTWSEILINGKKQNHSIILDSLNKPAQDRLLELFMEAESIIALRINATHRLYGYMTGRVFNILWFDTDHGDNSECVCRSHLKHT